MIRTLAQLGCSIEGCEAPHLARGWCSRHYSRWRKTGDAATPSTRLPKSATREERFWVKVRKTNDCWEWIGSRNQDGYGTFWWGRSQGAHRISYTLVRGPIAPGLELDHLCKNRACVNPDHLEPVTHLENVRRGDGPPNRGATHCVNGHEFTPANTYTDRRGWRSCRTCSRELGRIRDRKRRALRKERAAS